MSREEKKQRVVEVVEEFLEHDSKDNHDHRSAPQKVSHEKDTEDCDCRCCLKRSRPKRELKTMPCGHQMGGRNLIVCIDGTANQFGKKNTNVIELYNLIMKGTNDDQCTWYNSGIGTYARPHWRSLKYGKQVLWHKVDLAIAWNFEKTVQGAYRWLVDNYQEGDCFSRGAFQVRALSAMIEKVGLIHKGNEMQIPFAYELYADPSSDEDWADPVGSAKPDVSTSQSTWAERLKEALGLAKKKAPESGEISMSQRFKQAFSRPNVRVHFVGAWDTVSSIGVARGKRVLPGTTDGMTHVCYFRHALALDERRVKFLPEYAWGGTTLPPPDAGVKDKSGQRSHGDRIRPQVLEVWFPGTHSDIGGGNTNNAGMDRSRPPLSDDPTFWNTLRDDGLKTHIKLLEVDVFYRAADAVKKFLDGADVLELFKQMAADKPGSQFLYDEVIETIRTWDRREPKLGMNDQYRLLSTMTDILGVNSRNLKLVEMGQVYSSLVNLWKSGSDEHRNVADAFLRRFTEGVTCVFKLQGHIESVRSVAISPDSKRIVSGSWDDTIRIWNMETGAQVGEPLLGHGGDINSVAISPDGKLIVSGSDDKTIRIWDAETGMQVGESLRGHEAHHLRLYR
ncbi:hypothetical protein H1R20_g982, partial [Candolleomyces eurysporus]